MTEKITDKQELPMGHINHNHSSNMKLSTKKKVTQKLSSPIYIGW